MLTHTEKQGKLRGTSSHSVYESIARETDLRLYREWHWRIIQSYNPLELARVTLFSEAKTHTCPETWFLLLMPDGRNYRLTRLVHCVHRGAKLIRRLFLGRPFYKEIDSRVGRLPLRFFFYSFFPFFLFESRSRPCVGNPSLTWPWP